MKKTAIALILASLLLFGCENGTSDTRGDTSAETTAADTGSGTHSHSGFVVRDGDTYKIPDDCFADAVNEVYTYYEDFLGGRIEIEGVYMADMYNNEMYYSVYRMEHVHCHEDHDHSSDPTTKVGFRISYDGNKPMDKAYVKVSGILETYELEGSTYLIINADTLTECD